MAETGSRLRHLLVVFGDQLSDRLASFDGFDKDRDAVLMMESQEEASYIPQHKTRLVLFFSAMRHFRDRLRDKGLNVQYSCLDDAANRGTFAAELLRRLEDLRPERVIATQPGDVRVDKILRDTAKACGIGLEIRSDTHFLCDLETFREWADGRKSLLMESFYRRERRRLDILVDGNDPVGGQWNFDEDNRKSFSKDGPPDIKAPRSFRPEDITQEVMALVDKTFADSPGTLEHFDYPVTRTEARAALRDFIDHRLPEFGDYQDAMATGRPYLFHSRLSCALNLHLLDPREVVDAALEAYEDGAAPINAVEGFIRQVIGWREYVRGIYWTRMPDYGELNHFDAELDMPAFMWAGETDLNCVRQCVAQLHDHAYAHHIQRLMVLGLLALLLGVRPQDVHRWHMSMYVDAIDWVSLPNVLGMSQYGDGGIMASKPYAASGNYINRMSDYCRDCRYNPGTATGEAACPFTTLFWDFLSRNRQKLQNNRRMGFMYKNLDRKDDGDRRRIKKQADDLRAELTAETYR